MGVCFFVCLLLFFISFFFSFDWCTLSPPFFCANLFFDDPWFNVTVSSSFASSKTFKGQSNFADFHFCYFIVALWGSLFFGKVTFRALFSSCVFHVCFFHRCARRETNLVPVFVQRQQERMTDLVLPHLLLVFQELQCNKKKFNSNK